MRNAKIKKDNVIWGRPGKWLHHVTSIYQRWHQAVIHWLFKWAYSSSSPCPYKKKCSCTKDTRGWGPLSETTLTDRVPIVLRRKPLLRCTALVQLHWSACTPPKKTHTYMHINDKHMQFFLHICWNTNLYLWKFNQTATTTCALAFLAISLNRINHLQRSQSMCTLYLLSHDL